MDILEFASHVDVNLVTANAAGADYRKSEEIDAAIEQSDDMDLQGLAEEILEQLNFMQVDIQSQTMQVSDKIETRQRQLGSGGQAVNWCPRT